VLKDQAHHRDVASGPWVEKIYCYKDGTRLSVDPAVGAHLLQLSKGKISRLLCAVGGQGNHVATAVIGGKLARVSAIFSLGRCLSPTQSVAVLSFCSKSNSAAGLWPRASLPLTPQRRVSIFE